MNNYQKELIKEHKELTERLSLIYQAIDSKYDSVTENCIEYCNLCIQAKGMEMYSEALCARLYNADITIVNGEYCEKVKYKDIYPTCNIPSADIYPTVGNDYNKDAETLNNTQESKPHE